MEVTKKENPAEFAVTASQVQLNPSNRHKH